MKVNCKLIFEWIVTLLLIFNVSVKGLKVSTEKTFTFNILGLWITINGQYKMIHDSSMVYPILSFYQIFQIMRSARSNCQSLK